MATAVLTGTLDTKGTEYAYLKQCLIELGVDVIVIDVGILREPAMIPDISANDVARAAGTDLAAVRLHDNGGDTCADAVETMSKGLEICLKRLISEGKCDAVFGMGGSNGTNLVSAAFQKLPLGIPKLIVSTMMTSNVRQYVGTSDMMMMYSVTDIAGLNKVSKLILSNAANAVAGLALYFQRSQELSEKDNKPLVGITMFGITTPGVLCIRKILEEHGFDVIVFHAIGTGGDAMEKMIRSGLIKGVIDYTPTELCDYRFGGVFPCSEDRLTAAPETGIPQVFVPGAIEVLTFGGKKNVPPKFRVPERRMVVHNPTVAAVKATKEELKILGEMIGTRLSRSKGETIVMLPLGGLDAYDVDGGVWRDEDADKELFESIRAHVKSNSVKVVEKEGNVNDPVFATAVAEQFLDMWERRK